MERRGVLRRTAVAGLALVTATTIVGAASGGVAMAAPSSPSRAEAPGAADGGVVKDRYIVVLKDAKASAEVTRSKAQSLTSAVGGSVRQTYSNAIRGFSAQLTAEQAKRLATHADVSYVEPVRRASANDTQNNPPSWGLDRIDQATPAPSGSYTYPTTASNVTAYVLDTGINISHQDFGGRASYGYDFIDGDTVADDCRGHGTHVAGTVGGTTYGVAKAVKLVAVRVLDCGGGGTSEEIIAGIDWVTRNAVKPAVANMSLGFGEVDPVVDQAVQNSINSGVSYAVSAGNGYEDACGVSPASVASAITVGATDNVDLRTWFSNFGPCVDLFAPGANILSAAGTTNGVARMHGTSMASPHVAGAAALLLSANPNWTPQQVRNAIVTNATSGAVQDVMGSSNRLLRVGTSEAVRSSVALRAVPNNRFVALGNGTQQVIANHTTVAPEDRFDVVDAGNGFVAMRSKATGLYVSADDGGSRPLVTNGPRVDAWERFQVFHNTDGTVSFKAVNGKFVSVGGGGPLPLIADGPSIGLWEKFEYVAPAPVVVLKVQVNNKYVSATNAGQSPLVAEGPAPGAWEKLELVDAGAGTIALKALVNNKWVSAPNGGASPLIAQASTVGTSERFWVYDYLSDGTVALVADNNGYAVTAPNGGASPLIANADYYLGLPDYGLSSSEKFIFEAVQP